MLIIIADEEIGKAGTRSVVERGQPVVMFPSLTLVALVLSVNLLGDWLRDALNPQLR